jgi:hypothetical protein
VRFYLSTAVSRQPNERLENGDEISDEESALMARALEENSVVVAQMTPFFK